MLRLWVLVLLLLNGAYFAWGQGWLLAYGWGPVSQREPLRLARQLHPEAISLLSQEELAKALQALETKEKLKPNVPVCLMSPALDTSQAAALQEVLKTAVPAQAWSLQAAPVAAQWIIYMGKYTNPADLDKKREQLRALKIGFETLTDPAWAPGLSLGRFESQASATVALEAMIARGVKTAKVVQSHAAGEGVRVRLPMVDDALAARLQPVRAALGEQALVPCTND